MDRPFKMGFSPSGVEIFNYAPLNKSSLLDNYCYMRIFLAFRDKVSSITVFTIHVKRSKQEYLAIIVMVDLGICFFLSSQFYSQNAHLKQYNL